MIVYNERELVDLAAAIHNTADIFTPNERSECLKMVICHAKILECAYNQS